MNIIKSIILSLILTIMTGELISQTEKKVTDAVGLSIGTTAPLFSAIDADSVKFSLNDAIKEGPVVLIFYRGFW
jgi:peroxiredoxin